jgi:WD domain, G-beta repeat.
MGNTCTVALWIERSEFGFSFLPSIILQQIWDLSVLNCAATLSEHNSVVDSIAFGSGCLFSGSDDNQIKVWSNGILKYYFSVLIFFPFFKRCGRVMALLRGAVPLRRWTCGREESRR